MDKEHVKGAADRTSGAVKEGVGKMTGDTSMKVKGKLDKAKGEARTLAGDLKDNMRSERDRDLEPRPRAKDTRDDLRTKH